MNEQEEKSVFPPEEPDFEDPNFNWEGWDKLGFKGVAENIVTDIEAFGTPLIYGVYGRWGSGKTSMMRAIQDCFKARKGYKTVWFDPWWYEHVDREQLFLGLLNKIQKEIYPKGRELRNIGMKAAAGALALGRLAVDKVVSTENLEDYYKRASKLIGKNQLEVVDAVEKAHADLEKAIEKALDKADAETLVLFVDDLDRCLPDRAILLLDQLKNFLYLPRVITVLGIDEEVFARMLNRHYGYHSEKEVLNQKSIEGKEESGRKDRQDFGRQYLKKIVRKSYRINVKTLKELLKQYEGYSDWFRLHPKLTSVMGQLWGVMKPPIPRELKRCAEKFLSLSRFKECGDVLTSIGERQNQANEITWNQFLDTVKAYMGMDSSRYKQLNVLHHVAMLLLLWEVVVLSGELDFPLDPKVEYKAHQELLKKNSTLPIPILNQVYNEIVTLS
jgi:hypothetical protein